MSRRKTEKRLRKIGRIQIKVCPIARTVKIEEKWETVTNDPSITEHVYFSKYVLLDQWKLERNNIDSLSKHLKINVWVVILCRSFFVGEECLLDILPGNLNDDMYYNYLKNTLTDILEKFQYREEETLFLCMTGHILEIVECRYIIPTDIDCLHPIVYTPIKWLVKK